MKIKTISDELRWAGDFDRKVNAALEEGWQLLRREVIPGSPNDSNKLYAELLQLDPEPEQETIDAIQALHIVKAACLAHKGPCNDCPMTDWCQQLALGGDPTDWELPELSEEVPF